MSGKRKSKKTTLLSLAKTTGVAAKPLDAEMLRRALEKAMSQSVIWPKQ